MIRAASSLPSWLPAAVTPADWQVAQILGILIVCVLLWMATTTKGGDGQNGKGVQVR